MPKISPLKLVRNGDVDDGAPDVEDLQRRKAKAAEPLQLLPAKLLDDDESGLAQRAGEVGTRWELRSASGHTARGIRLDQ